MLEHQITFQPTLFMPEKLANIEMLILDVDGTLTDAGIYILDDGRQFKKFNARDGIGIRQARAAGIEVGIISHSMSSEMVDTRANMLGLKYWYVGNEPKTKILNQWINEIPIDPEKVAFIGDDINDIEIMEMVGFGACPADAVPAVLAQADLVLEHKGGEGCVREFIDKYLLS